MVCKYREATPVDRVVGPREQTSIYILGSEPNGLFSLSYVGNKLAQMYVQRKKGSRYIGILFIVKAFLNI